jgi:hypothetical protein
MSPLALAAATPILGFFFCARCLRVVRDVPSRLDDAALGGEAAPPVPAPAEAGGGGTGALTSSPVGGGRLSWAVVVEAVVR